ncbi:hypothetical protein YC2023_048412 [Brassica napus]
MVTKKVPNLFELHHILVNDWLFEARFAATRICKAVRDWSQSIGVAARASRFLPRCGLMYHQRLQIHMELRPGSRSSGFFFRWLFEAWVAATRICKAARDWSQSIGVAPWASRFLPRRGLMYHQRLQIHVELRPGSRSSGFFFRWLFEARVSATKICKAAREWSQSIGVAPRASRFLPRRGLMFHQRLQIHVALRPGLVSAFP